MPEGGFVFAHYQVIDQNNVIMRPLQLDSPTETTSLKLREEVRAKLKEKTLLPLTGSAWTRTSEVFWDLGFNGEQPFQPLRFPPESISELKDMDLEDLRNLPKKPDSR